MTYLLKNSQAINIDGAKKSRSKLTSGRISIVMIVIILLFMLILGRLYFLGNVDKENKAYGFARDVVTASRPNILDRNGAVIALDIVAPSLYAEPRNIIDIEEAVAKLLLELPELDEK